MGVISVEALPADPLEALRELSRGEAELDRLRAERVRAARAAGASWEQVGEALGVTRQSAWEHFTARTRVELAENAEANTELSDDEATALAVDEVRSARTFSCLQRSVAVPRIGSCSGGSKAVRSKSSCARPCWQRSTRC